MIGVDFVKRQIERRRRVRQMQQRAAFRQASARFAALYFRRTRSRKYVLGPDGRLHPYTRIAPFHSNWWTRLNQRMKQGPRHAQ